jgi:DNA-binding MarR family transcriptional regulator
MSEINYKYVSIKLGNHKPPVFKVIKNQDWIEFGVEPPYKNNYPKYLQSLYERANLHGAFLKAKHYYISGAGLTIDKSAKTVGDISELLQMLKETNSLGESISDILNKCVLDYVIFGGCYVEVNWSINGKKFEITHMPFNNLRRSVNNDGFWYSNDWSQSKQNQTKEKTELEFIPDYDIENASGKQIYALKSYGLGTEYYPKPEYLGLVPCAEVETEISNYHLNAIKSGFHIGTIITFIGKPSPTEQDEIERQLKNKFQGTDAAGSLLLQFTRDKDGQPQITRLSADDLDKKFETLTKWVDQQLTAGHHMSPIIAGIKTEGQLGGRSEIDLAFDLFKNTWVKPNQKVIENWINKLYEFYGFEDRIKFKEVRPIAPFDYSTILSYMTKDEIREYAGLARLKEDTGSVSLADTLGVISPLVATKVLEKMTDDEIRSIVNLKELTEEQRTILNPTQQFSTQSISVEDIIISEFSQVGESTSFYNIIESRDMTPEDYQSYATSLEKSILAILEKDPLATDRTIAEALKKEEKTITEAIARMVSDGLVEMGEKNQEGVQIRKAKVSSDGKDLAEESKVAEMEVRYFYDWKTEIPSTQRDTSAHPSRPFCKRLMDLDKLYTRADIDRISNRVGLNVFMYGGGWWNMGNGVNSPSCRHIWKSVIVKRK